MSENDASLQALYPFLHDKKKGGENKKENKNKNESLLQSVQIKANDSIEAKQQFFSEHAQALVDAARTIAQCYQQGGKLLAMGNGGSSCDATHIAVEFQHPVTAGRPSLPAMNLSNDSAFFSAVANDIGVKHVFSRQIEAHANSNDCIVAFSTSGNSENIISGLQKAKDLQLATIGFCGANGGMMKSSGLLDHCLLVETDSIHRVQEVHVSCYHILWDLTHTLLADSRGKIND